MNPRYTVFLDESFDGFMNLSKDDGYFCYAALMVPTAKLPDLERFWAANREKLATAYARATGFQPQGEFKSGLLNKLGFETRRTFGDRLARFLAKNDCYVAGFYTTVRNTLLYRVRTEVAKADEARELPPDWERLVASEKARLLEDKPNHPGDAHVLVWPFHQTLSITMNWLTALGQDFAVVYDPRQKREDRYLITHADDWLRREAEAKKMGEVYKGVTAALRSSESSGLILVDLVLRDVRHLFQDVPELLIEQSGLQLILLEQQAAEVVPMESGGHILKWGDRRPMTEALQRRLACPTPNSTVPLYFQSLAGGKLSCNAAFGESRVVNFGLRAFEDMVD
ncbi:MAG: hypothetical protein AB7O66_06370 [Limisphaerales bacterium]